jgi:hypothetical protein
MVFVDSSTRLCIELLHIPVEGVSDFREISAPPRIFLHIRRRVCHTAMLEVWQAYLQASNNDIERLWDSHLERAASLSVLGRWVAALRELVTTGQAVLARSRIDARRLRRLTSRRSQWEYAR